METRLNCVVFAAAQERPLETEDHNLINFFNVGVPEESQFW